MNIVSNAQMRKRGKKGYLWEGKMNYCEHCRALCEENTCQNCKRHTREVKNEDFCLLAETEELTAKMLTDALQQENIPVVCVPQKGVGFSLVVVFSKDTYKVFVPYDRLTQAQEIYSEMFGADDEKSALGITVTVTVDRPLGSVHPEHPDIVYPVNYGFVENVMGGDGDWQDAYILGVDSPVKSFTGVVVAVLTRQDDVETKWVVAPKEMSFTREEIKSKTAFQEKFFLTEILM